MSPSIRPNGAGSGLFFHTPSDDPRPPTDELDTLTKLSGSGEAWKMWVNQAEPDVLKWAWTLMHKPSMNTEAVFLKMVRFGDISVAHTHT